MAYDIYVLHEMVQIRPQRHRTWEFSKKVHHICIISFLGLKRKLTDDTE